MPDAAYPPGMKTERLEMRIEPEWIAKVDDWRRRQTAIPSRAEAIRRLIQLGLQVAQAPRGSQATA